MKIARTALAVPALLLLAACGTDKASTMSDSSVAAPAPAARDAVGSGGEAVDDGALAFAPEGADPDAAEKPTGPEAQTRSVISKGQISLHTSDVDEARFELKKLLDQWDATIANEESSADEKGRTDRQRLELRVPSKYFDDAMDEISGLGTLVDRSRNAEDVTTQVIDTNARVRTQKLSLARVQALLAKAKDLNQIISIEAQLSQRQADLDSLEQQQQYLAEQSALSTINLYLSVPDDDEVADEGDDDGFFGGLASGWDSFVASGQNVLHALGAVLPFGLLLALIGVPVWKVWRRRTPAAPAAGPAA